MQDRQFSNTINTTAGEHASGFAQIGDSFGDTLGEFKELQADASLSSFTRFLKPASEKIQRAAQFTAGYSRRHPIRIAVTVAAIGFAIAALVKPARKIVGTEELH